MIAVASILLLVGAALLVYSYAAGPPARQSLSFNIDWPLTTYTENILAYNGSMHIDLFLFSNGSITQGQKVIAASAGGLASNFAGQVKNVFLNFQGASPCVTKVCSEMGIIYNLSPTQIVLNKNEATQGLSPITEEGPVNFTTSLGMGPSWGGGEGIFWQSAGTYYISMQIEYANGSMSAPYTLSTQPVYVAPAPTGLSTLDILVIVFLTVGSPVFSYYTGGVYLLDRRRDRKKEQLRQQQLDASFRENVNRQNKKKDEED